MRKIKKQHIFKTIAAAIAVCVVFITSATAAYAMDVGGIQCTVQLWLHGDRTNATLRLNDDGTYRMKFTDADGNEGFRAGGGVSLSEDGGETPMTEEELMEHLTMPEVEYEDDGSVWVYWYDQKIDITDKFEDGVCYVKLVSDTETKYVTVKYQNGYAVNDHKYYDSDTWINN